MPSLRWPLALSIAVLLVAGLAAQTTAPGRPRSAGGAGPRLDAITDQEIRADVQFLSSDALEGRAPSTRGGSLAAQYVATRFKLLGLAPGGEHGTYFQPVTIVESKVDASAGVTVSGGTGAPDLLKPTEQVVAWTGVEETEVNVDADLVFVGYGINAPEQKWNDYAGLDVKGKVVMMMVNDPPATASEPTLFGGKALTYYGRWTYKFEEAARQGAADAEAQGLGHRRHGQAHRHPIGTRPGRFAESRRVARVHGGAARAARVDDHPSDPRTQTVAERHRCASGT